MKNLATPSIPDISINKDLISRLNLHPTNFGLFDNFDVFYISECFFSYNNCDFIF